MIRQLSVILLMTIAVAVAAGEVDIPNTFVNGQVADADEVNENFNAIEDAVDDNAQKLQELMDRITELEGLVATGDFDGDGFSGAGGDCDDTDPNINPDAFDVSNDGIDSDCDGFDGVTGTLRIVNTSNTQIFFVQFEIQNSGDVITKVEIRDNVNYTNWLPSSSVGGSVYNFENQGFGFNVPISVRITGAGGGILTINNVITSFNGGEIFDTGTNF